MDYEEFNKEYKKFEMWNENEPIMWGELGPDSDVFEIDFSNDKKFPKPIMGLGPKNGIRPTGFIPDDRVNSPSHYTSGRMEAIDIIEDAISTAPTPGKGLLQAQVLKYILRLWLKDSPVEDAKKAEWYLRRLIDSLE